MRGYPTPIKPKKQPKRNEHIIAEIGEDNYAYIVSHHGRPRTKVAKHIGVSKFQLNMYYITLYGSEAM
jgi:hypothetical protein